MWNFLPATVDGQTNSIVPLVLVILLTAWAVFILGVLQQLNELNKQGGRRVLISLICGGVGSVLLSALIAPEPPVVSTHTGLAHVVSSLHIARFDWAAFFPYEYPLSVPTWASMFQHFGLVPVDAFSWSNRLLFAFGAMGVGLLSYTRWKTNQAVWLAMALWSGMVPLLLFSSSDALVMGESVLFVWWWILGLRVVATDGSKWNSVQWIALSVLLAQSRLEALALWPGLILLSYAWGQWVGIRKAISHSLVAALLSLPAFLHVLAGVEATHLGFHRVPTILLSGGLFALFLVLRWWLAGGTESSDGPVEKGGRGVVWWALVGWFVLSVAVVAVGGFGALGPGGGIGEANGVLFQTYRDGFVWLFDSSVIPWSWLLLALLGLLTLRSMTEGLAVVCLVSCLLAVSSLKATGELPLEGLRTQLPVFAVVVVLVVGGVEAVRGWLARSSIRSVLLVFLLIPLWPLTLHPVMDTDYAARQQFEFLASTLPTLPEGAEVYVPDAPIDAEAARGLDENRFGLFRYGLVASALGLEERLTVRPLRQLGGTESADVYLFRGLGCYRTGSIAVLEQCRCLSEFADEGQAHQRVYGWLYTSDFLDEIAIVNNAAPGVVEATVTLIPWKREMEKKCSILSD